MQHHLSSPPRGKRVLLNHGIDQKYISPRYDSAECFLFGDAREGRDGPAQGGNVEERDSFLFFSLVTR